MRRLFALLPLLLTATAAASAFDAPSTVPGSFQPAAESAPMLQGVTIVRKYPHDRHAFTEGLFYLDGNLFESTGLTGLSYIRQVRLEDGKVLRQVKLPPDLFGEGIVDWKGDVISLTWQTGIGFRWRRSDFRKLGEFHYDGEGWGLTRNAREIVMSDGTPVLRFLDPATLKIKRRLTVTDNGTPITYLNELEWVKDEILANVWLTDNIVRIDPKTGRVKDWIDLAPLRGPSLGEDDVLNGIAWDSKRDRLFVTGKNWPFLYEIKLADGPGS